MRMALIAALSMAAIAPALLAPAMAQQGGGQGGGQGSAMLERLKMADANKDGAITRAEMRTMREAAFRRMDANNDGFITAEEREDIADAAAAKGKGKGAERRGGMGGNADANNDGKISRDEFLNTPMRGFDRIDANRNDIIEAAELANAQAMMARRKQVTP
jgi:Ca2+-binding EF-hand superfamily protein